MAQAPSQIRVRPPAVAGRFYPSDAGELTALVRRQLSTAQQASDACAVPRAVIAPHAGFMYSGPIAAAAFAPWRAIADRARRVVLLGPSHHFAFEGIAAPASSAFDTPLGEVPVDTDATQQLTRLPFVHVADEPHVPEHALETHLPFIQQVLESFAIVPLVIGRAQPADVSQVLGELWGGEETLISVSSDLSHFLDYETAKQADRRTADTIEALDPDTLQPRDACGAMAVNGLLHLAKRRGMQAATIDLRNSGDTAGGRDRVVGYGAFTFA